MAACAARATRSHALSGSLRALFFTSTLVLAGSLPAAGVVYELVPVALPGAAGDPRKADWQPFANLVTWPRTGLGSVAYRYRIGKYPVTVEQYTEFLNAVAADDPNNYWDPKFAQDFWQELYNGVGTRRVLWPATILRSGAPGFYAYSVIAGTERLPMPRPGPRRAFAFANWMHNGQPTGLQDASTTEDGCYDMTVLPPMELGPPVKDHPVPPRKAGCRFWVPSIDEAHKAAYCEPDGSGGCLWRTWPAQPAEVSYIEDVVPGGIRYVNPPRGDRPPDPEPGTYAICQYDGGIGSAPSCPFEARGGPNVVTDVDAYASPSPWGAHGMAGNVFEATDTEIVPEQPGSVFVWGGDLAHGRQDSSAHVITSNWFTCPSCVASVRLAAPERTMICGLGWELIGLLVVFAVARSRRSHGPVRRVPSPEADL
jgi:hypothetical protein